MQRELPIERYIIIFGEIVRTTHLIMAFSRFFPPSRSLSLNPWLFSLREWKNKASQIPKQYWVEKHNSWNKELYVDGKKWIWLCGMPLRDKSVDKYSNCEYFFHLIQQCIHLWWSHHKHSHTNTLGKKLLRAWINSLILINYNNIHWFIAWVSIIM